jgi:hypothetical protein
VDVFIWTQVVLAQPVSGELDPLLKLRTPGPLSPVAQLAHVWSCSGGEKVIPKGHHFSQQASEFTVVLRTEYMSLTPLMSGDLH